MSKNLRGGAIALAIGIVVTAAVAATLLTGGDVSRSSQDGGAERQAALASEHAPTAGAADAKVHIVEFLDPACGTCAMFYPMVKQWMNEVPGKMRLSVRHVPFHRGSDYAVRVLEASREQGKYWETLEALLSTQREIDSLARDEMDRSQRESYLRYQMKAIMEELGEGNEVAEEIERYLWKSRKILGALGRWAARRLALADPLWTAGAFKGQVGKLERRVVLEREAWRVPETLFTDALSVRPFLAGEELGWRYRGLVDPSPADT